VRELPDRGRVGPERVGGCDLGKVGVVDGEQAALLEVRQHDSPASLQVGERPVEDQPLEGLLVFAADGGQVGLAVLVGEVGVGKSQCLEHGLAEVGEREPVVGGCLQGFADRRAEVDHLHEVVEVAGLESRVLAVVGEGEEFLVGEGVARLAEPVENREGRDRGGGAAALAAERGELCGLAGLRVEESAARGIEEERGRHEPALIFEGSRLRAVAIGVVIEPRWQPVGDLLGGRSAALGELEPRIGQFFEVGLGIPDVITHDDVAVGRLLVFDVFGEFSRRESGAGAADADERLAAHPTEDVGEDRLAVGILLVDAGLERDVAAGAAVERGVDRAGLGNELVEPVGEHRVAAASPLDRLVDRADPEQDAREGVEARLERLAGLLGELLSKFADRPGLAPQQFTGRFVEG